jgi:hypothetical protein
MPLDVEDDWDQPVANERLALRLEPGISSFFSEMDAEASQLLPLLTPCKLNRAFFFL